MKTLISSSNKIAINKHVAATFLYRSQISILSLIFSDLEKGYLFACVVMVNREEGVRRHISGSSEVPLKNYVVTKFYSEILRCELRLLQNIGEASVMSAPLFACHIKQLVINQLCRFCELYSFVGYRSQGLLPQDWNPSTMTCCQFPFFGFHAAHPRLCSFHMFPQKTRNWML